TAIIADSAYTVRCGATPGISGVCRGRQRGPGEISANGAPAPAQPIAVASSLTARRWLQQANFWRGETSPRIGVRAKCSWLRRRNLVHTARCAQPSRLHLARSIRPRTARAAISAAVTARLMPSLSYAPERGFLSNGAAVLQDLVGIACSVASGFPASN